jgi:hypothetical protein
MQPRVFFDNFVVCVPKQVVVLLPFLTRYATGLALGHREYYATFAFRDIFSHLSPEPAAGSDTTHLSSKSSDSNSQGPRDRPLCLMSLSQLERADQKASSKKTEYDMPPPPEDVSCMLLCFVTQGIETATSTRNSCLIGFIVSKPLFSHFL